MKSNYGINTLCTHTGEVEDKQFKGATSPIFMSTSYAFDGVDVKRYPRYFNTPNQEALHKKIAALEKTEAAIVFGSGMAAISSVILAFLQNGDHLILQRSIYGGTHNFVVNELKKYGISYSLTEGNRVEDFKSLIQPNTKAIYIETPSNPLLEVVDVEAIALLAKETGLVSMIDNTFASPINQNPAVLGIDIVIHSATKYMGGHSDILAGAVAASQKNIEKLWNTSICLGGSLSDFTVWMLERSLKTLNLRVQQQNKNAMELAEYLSNHKDVVNVFYPGLASHPNHDIAKKQMKGFGGMLSFELVGEIDAMQFQNCFKLIKPSMSLAGVESTTLNPAVASHALLTQEERDVLGITDGLIRFSCGIEDVEDIIADIDQAIATCKK